MQRRVNCRGNDRGWLAAATLGRHPAPHFARPGCLLGNSRRAPPSLMASLVTLAAAVSRPDVVKRSIHDMGANVTTPLVPPLVPNFSLPTKTAVPSLPSGLMI